MCIKKENGTYFFIKKDFFVKLHIKSNYLK